MRQWNGASVALKQNIKYYNHERLHSYNGYQTPAETEEKAA
jgi:transposase InsO family protein